MVAAERVVHAAQVIVVAEVSSPQVFGVVAPDLEPLMVAAPVVAGMLQAVDQLQDARLIGELRGRPRIAGGTRLEPPEDSAHDDLRGPQTREPAELIDIVAADIGCRIGRFGHEVPVERAPRANVRIRLDHRCSCHAGSAVVSAPPVLAADLCPVVPPLVKIDADEQPFLAGAVLDSSTPFIGGAERLHRHHMKAGLERFHD